jgi:hypothetical protein
LTGKYDPAAWNVDCAIVEPFPRTRFVPESVERTPEFETTAPVPDPTVSTPWTLRFSTPTPFAFARRIPAPALRTPKNPAAGPSAHVPPALVNASPALVVKELVFRPLRPMYASDPFCAELPISAFWAISVSVVVVRNTEAESVQEDGTSADPENFGMVFAVPEIVGFG